MTKFAVPDMSCARAMTSIEDALTQVDPEARIEGDVSARTLRIETNASAALVLSVLSQIGYAANVAR